MANVVKKHSISSELAHVDRPEKKTPGFTRLAPADEHRTAETAARGVVQVDGVDLGGAEQHADEALRRLNITDKQCNGTSGYRQYEAKRQSVTQSDRVIHNASISAIRTSNPRPPSSVGRPAASTSRRCGRTRKRPNSIAVGVDGTGSISSDTQLRAGCFEL
jgi:hypothetical protein